MAEKEYNQQDWSIIPPDLNTGGIDLSAGVSPTSVPQPMPEMDRPNPDDYTSTYFPQMPEVQPPVNPIEANTQNIHNIADNFIYNTEYDSNPMKGTQVLGNFYNSDYGMNQYVRRYAQHNKYEDLGFTPFLDNETRYNEASTYWDELSRAGSQWSTLAGLGFTDAMSFGDVTDRKTAKRFKEAMDVGSSTDSGAFGTNLFLNSGYTIGIIGELAVEEGLLALGAIGLGIAEVPTLGAATPLLAADVAAMGARATRAFGKIGSAWKMTKNLGKTLKNLKDVNKARDYFSKTMKATGRVLNPLENASRFYKNRKFLQAKHGTDALGKLKTTTRGFAEFYKDVRNIRLAYGEGALEGGMVENQMVKDLTTEWMAENPGVKMDDATSKKIRETAHKAGVVTTLTNAPVIALSNKIVLDGIFRPGQFSKKLVGDVFESGLGKKILFNPKKAMKDAYSMLPKNYFARKWNYIRNPRLGAQAALGYATKYSAANIAEGLQEVAQEAIAGTNEDYYTAKYNDDVGLGGYYSYVASNIGKQFSGQGFETFMSGFLMGGIAGPIANVGGKAVNTAGQLFDPKSDMRVRGFKYAEQEDGTGKYTTLGRLGKAVGLGKGTQEQIDAAEQLDRKRQEKLNDVVNTLNEFNNDPENYLSPELVNMLEQKELSNMMKAAEEAGDVKGYYDFKNTAGFKHVLTALRYGRLGTHVNQLKEFKSLTQEEIRQSYNIDKPQFDREIDKAINRAERLEKRFDKAKELFPNPFDPSQYAKNGALYIQAAKAKIAWDNAIEEFIFNQESFDNAQQRMESILNKAKDKLNLQNTPYSQFNAVFSLKNTQDEINLLKLEISALEEGGTKKSDSGLQKKKRKLKALEDYASALETAKADRIASIDEAVTPAVSNKLKKAFNRYTRILAGENGDYVAGEKLDEVFQEVLDYASLSERRQVAMDAVNTLTNPSKFQESFDRILAIQDKLYENKKENIEKSLKKYLKAIDENDLLQDLYKAGMFFNIEELKKLKEDGTIPKTFYYTNTSNKTGREVSDLEVQKNSEDYLTAIEILQKYYVHLTGMPITQEAIGDPYAATVREKLKGDNRTLADLAAQYGFEPGAVDSKVELKKVLESIIDSKYATEQEKMLAAELLKTAVEGEFVTFSSTMSTPGEYTEEAQTKIDPRYSASNYTKKNIKSLGRDLPIEVQILRYEIQRRVNESLDTNGEFKNNIETLKNEAMIRFAEMVNNGEEIDFNYNTFLSSNEAFIQGAMTDAGFQKFLAGIPSKLTTNNKNGWQQFVDSVLDALKVVFGKRPNGTVLNAAMDIITAEIGGEQSTVTENAEPVRQDGKTTSAEDGPINIKESPTSLYKEHEEFMTSMVDEYKAQSDAREQNNEDALGRFTDKDGKPLTTKQIINSRGFKTWWSQPFNAKKNIAILDYNIKSNSPAGFTNTSSSDFTNEEVDKIRETGEISKSRLVALADKLLGPEDLTPNEKAVLAVEAVSKQYNELVAQRRKMNERRERDGEGIITIPMRNQLIALGWNDVLIDNMSTAEAVVRIADGVPLSELREQAAKKEIDANNKLAKERQNSRNTVTRDFEKTTNMQELEAEYDKVISAIEMNLDNFAKTLDPSTFDIDALYQANVERLANELNYDDLYVGNALLLQSGKIAVIDQMADDGSYIALVTDKKGNQSAIRFNKDNMSNLVKARYSPAWTQKSATEEKGKEITPEEANISNNSIDVDAQTEFEESINKEVNPEDADNNFMDSLNKRCK